MGNVAAKYSAIIKPQKYIKMNKIKELLDNSKLTEIEHPDKSAYWHLLKLRKEMQQALDLACVSESDFEDKLYAKCLEYMTDMTIDEFNDALKTWTHQKMKRKQINDFCPHSR